jgi:hypothetical protein
MYLEPLTRISSKKKKRSFPQRFHFHIKLCYNNRKSSKQKDGKFMSGKRSHGNDALKGIMKILNPVAYDNGKKSDMGVYCYGKTDEISTSLNECIEGAEKKMLRGLAHVHGFAKDRAYNRARFITLAKEAYTEERIRWLFGLVPKKCRSAADMLSAQNGIADDLDIFEDMIVFRQMQTLSALGLCFEVDTNRDAGSAFVMPERILKVYQRDMLGKEIQKIDYVHAYVNLTGIAEIPLMRRDLAQTCGMKCDEDEIERLAGVCGQLFEDCYMLNGRLVSIGIDVSDVDSFLEIGLAARDAFVEDTDGTPLFSQETLDLYIDTRISTSPVLFEFAVFVREHFKVRITERQKFDACEYARGVMDFDARKLMSLLGLDETYEKCKSAQGRAASDFTQAAAFVINIYNDMRLYKYGGLKPQELPIAFLLKGDDVHSILPDSVDPGCLQVLDMRMDDEPPVAKKNKVGRNDLCPCGSGKKYKKCCGR